MAHTPQTRWQHLATTSDISEDRLTMSFHVVEMNSGEEFTISVTGRGSVQGGYFMGAALTTAEILRQVLKADRLPPVLHVPKLNLN